MALLDSHVNSQGVSDGFIVIGDVSSYVPSPHMPIPSDPSANIEVRRFISQAAAQSNMMWTSSMSINVPLNVGLLGTASLRKLAYVALKQLSDYSAATDVIIPPAS